MSVKRVYESTFIINAALEDPDIDAVIAKVTGYIENHGGELIETDKWGRRRLAYPINKKFNGFYVHVIFEAMPDSVPVLERFMVLEDTILRHLTLILPEELREYRTQKALAKGEEESAKALSTDSGKDKDKESSKKETAKVAENAD